MSKTMKTKPAFVRERRDGHYVYVKRLAFGAEVHRIKDGFEAYDKNGKFLGSMFSSQENAEYCAVNGFTTWVTDKASELSLWPAWNDVVDCGKQVLVAEDSTQVVYLGFDIYMTAKDDRGGWTVELITDCELSERYYDDENDCFRLKPIRPANAYRVE